MSGSAGTSPTSDSLQQLQRRLQRTLPNAQLEVSALAACPTLSLALINADFDTGPLPGEVMRAVLAEPAYWAFCWGSGLAMAQLLLEQPARVQGKTVLDFGSGSGIAGIAAAKAGAERVIACDTDPDARLATTANAQLNQVKVSVAAQLSAITEPVDLILVADVLYDRSNLPLLHTLETLAPALLIADSRISDLRSYGYQAVHERVALTTPNLGEFDEYRTVRFFAAAPAARGTRGLD